MNLIDLRDPDGPYWKMYQTERQREGIIDNPDLVPEWFLISVMKNRLAEARVALEHLSAPSFDSDHDEMHKVWAALRTLEKFIQFGVSSDPVGARRQVLAGLLGAMEVEIERERLDSESVCIEDSAGEETSFPDPRVHARITSMGVKTGSFEYSPPIEDDGSFVRKQYRVPAFKGGRVLAASKPGVIVGFKGQYLLVLLDGEEEPGKWHPVWRIEYDVLSSQIAEELAFRGDPSREMCPGCLDNGERSSDCDHYSDPHWKHHQDA